MMVDRVSYDQFVIFRAIMHNFVSDRTISQCVTRITRQQQHIYIRPVYPALLSVTANRPSN